MSDYSSTPLGKKLGIRAGSRVRLMDPPPGFAALLEPLPIGAHTIDDAPETTDVAIVFATACEDAEREFARVKQRLTPDGGLWIAYPKKSSGVPTGLTFNEVQRIGLAAGLVDNKSCAIDGTWTAVRFVVRRADRPTAPRSRPDAARRPAAAPTIRGPGS